MRGLLQVKQQHGKMFLFTSVTDDAVRDESIPTSNLRRPDRDSTVVISSLRSFVNDEKTGSSSSQDDMSDRLELAVPTPPMEVP